MYFSHFGDTCNFGSNGSTKLKESLLSLILFWRASLALVLESYVNKPTNKSFVHYDNVFFGIQVSSTYTFLGLTSQLKLNTIPW
jgi:hypothetical protein